MENINNNKTIPKSSVANWQDIPWNLVNLRVQDLQSKIVKATQENNINEVYKLQNQLVTSFEGRALGKCSDEFRWKNTRYW